LGLVTRCADDSKRSSNIVGLVSAPTKTRNHGVFDFLGCQPPACVQSVWVSVISPAEMW